MFLSPTETLLNVFLPYIARLKLSPLMGEALAVVGIIANIVQLVDFGSKILHRLSEFQSSIEGVPESFRHIKAELPVLLNTLQQTKEAVEAGSVRDETMKALLPAIEGCRIQIRSLDDVLLKILPASGDSWTKRSTKALRMSLRYDSKVEKITDTVRKYIQTLTYYHAAASSTLVPLTGRLFKALDCVSRHREGMGSIANSAVFE